MKSLHGTVGPQLNLGRAPRGQAYVLTKDPSRQARFMVAENDRTPGILTVQSYARPENARSYHAHTDPNAHFSNTMCLSVVESAAGRLAVVTASFAPNDWEDRVLLLPAIEDPDAANKNPLEISARHIGARAPLGILVNRHVMSVLEAGGNPVKEPIDRAYAEQIYQGILDGAPEVVQVERVNPRIVV